MGIQIDTQKVLIWDCDQNKMIPKTEVFVRIVTNKGSILKEEGPLYCSNGKEVFDATRILHSRLVASLPGVRL